MMKAKCFHEFFFNGLFGRLVSRSTSTPGERVFLLQEDTRSLWSPTNLYFLLPLEKLSDVCKGSLKIHWSGISSCVSAVEFLRQKFSSVAGDCDNGSKVSSPCDTNSSNVESTNKIHFANCVLDLNDLRDIVVLAIHTGKVYCIIEAVMDLSAESPFDGNNDKSAEPITFSNYFLKRCIICFNLPLIGIFFHLYSSTALPFVDYLCS